MITLERSRAGVAVVAPMPAPEELPSLGYTVSWHLSGIELEHDELEALLAAHGFAHHAPKPPTPRTALRRALVDWISERARTGSGPALAGTYQETGSGQRALIRVINSGQSDFLVCALVTEDVDLVALGLAHWTDLRLLLDKRTWRLTCTFDRSGAPGQVTEAAWVSAQIRPHWERHKRLHTAGDVSRVIRDIVAGLDAVSLRREGGYYFVPATQREGLSRLTELLASLPVQPGHEPFLLALPQPDVPAAKRQLAVAAHLGFVDELSRMRADLERLLEAEPGSVRQSTLESRLKEFAEFREKADTYARLLEMRRDTILTGLEDLRAKARQVVLKDDVAEYGEGPAAEQASFDFAA